MDDDGQETIIAKLEGARLSNRAEQHPQPAHCTKFQSAAALAPRFRWRQFVVPRPRAPGQLCFKLAHPGVRDAFGLEAISRSFIRVPKAARSALSMFSSSLIRAPKAARSALNTLSSSSIRAPKAVRSALNTFSSSLIRAPKAVRSVSGTHYR